MIAMPPGVENRTFAELAVGDTASMSRKLASRDVELLAALSGTNRMAGVQSSWCPILISTALQTRLPGPGTILVGQKLRFVETATVGDVIATALTVREKRADGLVLMDCTMSNQDGKILATGTVEVLAPAEKAFSCCDEIPDVRINEHIRHRQLIARCADLKPAITVVVHPCDTASLAAALDATDAGLIEPILVGPEPKIRAAAASAARDIAKFRLIDVPHSHAAASAAVALVRSGEVEAIMKGSLHTDELMHEVMLPDSGLRTERRLSHVYLFDVTVYPRPLFITDAAINILPSLADKRDICQNAIDLAHILGIQAPKVAILSAVETVSAKLPSTLDAAALCKMADRGQITGGVLDGPLAFDNAVSPEAARTKGILSPVAGQADILLVPNIEAGNMLAKQLTFFGDADGAGIVLGARLPIILTSRADPARTRIASCAIALLIAAAKRPSAASVRV
jgi:phosphotransacetylase